MKTETLIAPSILAANFGKLQDEVAMLNQSHADWIHCDVMDGHFVPNLSFGPMIIQAIKAQTQKPLDVHLMIQNPDNWINEYYEAGANILTIHIEACTHIDRTLHAIKAKGMLAGVALNPNTSIQTLENILYATDVVCVMSVNPGYGGQKFIANTFKKIVQLRTMIAEQQTNTLIEIDGGVSIENAGKLLAMGANVLVAGNAVFKHTDPKGVIEQLKNVR